jgi:hypothetical protein
MLYCVAGYGIFQTALFSAAKASSPSTSPLIARGANKGANKGQVKNF